MRSKWAFSLVFFAGVYSLAQSNQGTITGTVSDPAGAVVPTAQIEIKNTETGDLSRRGFRYRKLFAGRSGGNYDISLHPKTVPGWGTNEKAANSQQCLNCLSQQNRS